MPPFETDDVETYLRDTPLDDATCDFVRTMARDGAAIVPLGAVGEDLCDHAARDADRLFRSGKFSRVHDAWVRSTAIRQLAGQPQILDLLRAAYGREPFAFQTLNFQRGSQQHLHSDAVHFSSLPERFMCGVWIALEDVTLESGPVIYKPGSHRMPILKMRDVGVEADRPTYADYTDHYVPQFAARIAAEDQPPRLAVLKKGEALVWAANLAHGGSPIADPASTRRSLVVHYYFDGCAYYTPMKSNESRGRLRLRLPRDVATGLWRWPRRDGKRLPLSPRALLSAIRPRPTFF